MGVNYLDLAKQWGDALLRLQIRKMKDPAFDGGILCPACKHIHGRCPDAVYGLMSLADHTGRCPLTSFKGRLDISRRSIPISWHLRVGGLPLPAMITGWIRGMPAVER